MKLIRQAICLAEQTQWQLPFPVSECGRRVKDLASGIKCQCLRGRYLKKFLTTDYSEIIAE